MPKENKRCYKYCIVPCCKNTTIKTPTKIFFSVPKDPLKRKKWCLAMKRRDYKLSSKTPHYCCEDHFSIQEDMENYWRFHLMPGAFNAKLNSDILPHIFDCQKEHKPVPEIKNATKEKISSIKKEHLGESTSNIECVLKNPRRTVSS